MGLKLSDFKNNEDLMTDEVIQRGLEILAKNRNKYREWIKENDPVSKCPVCTFKNIGYSWDKIYCLDCGWSVDYEVKYMDVRVPNNLEAILKQAFGSKLGAKNYNEKITKDDLKKFPIKLNDFATGEYTEQEIEFLQERMDDILSTEHIEFSQKDMASVHFLALQELKLKKLFRRETIMDEVDSDLSKVKKDELTVYDKLKAKVDDIIEAQAKSDEELSLFDKISREFSKDDDFAEILDEYVTQMEEVEEKIKESEERRRKIRQSDYNIEEEISKIESEISEE